MQFKRIKKIISITKQIYDVCTVYALSVIEPVRYRCRRMGGSHRGWGLGWGDGNAHLTLSCTHHKYQTFAL